MPVTKLCLFRFENHFYVNSTQNPSSNLYIIAKITIPIEIVVAFLFNMMYVEATKTIK